MKIDRPRIRWLVWPIVLVCVVFGWSGGKKLVGESYDEAKVRASDMKASRGQLPTDAEDAAPPEHPA